jgi:hypothetical protein
MASALVQKLASLLVMIGKIGTAIMIALFILDTA